MPSSSEQHAFFPRFLETEWVIRIGIAVGLRVWFGTKWGDATAFGASVIENKISGAVSLLQVPK
jgi:hypothetical protein